MDFPLLVNCYYRSVKVQLILLLNPSAVAECFGKERDSVQDASLQNSNARIKSVCFHLTVSFIPPNVTFTAVPRRDLPPACPVEHHQRAGRSARGKLAPSGAAHQGQARPSGISCQSQAQSQSWKMLL